MLAQPLDLPATVLFSNFDGTARGVTEDFYREIFGPQFHPDEMHNTDDLLARGEVEQAKLEARDRFFAEANTALHPLRLPTFCDGTKYPPQEWKNELLAARAKMEELVPAYCAAVEKFDTVDSQFIEASQACSVYNCGIQSQQDDHLHQIFPSAAPASQGR